MSYAASSAGKAPGGPQMSGMERAVFAFGDVFGGGAAATLAVLYLFYLTDIVGLPPGLAGTTVVVSKIWDAINHPLMGVITDRTRSRWGRRKPWIFVGALLLPPAMAGLWAPIGDWESQTAKVWFVILAHLFWTTVASIVAVPYGSLSTEVTTNPDERSRVNVLRLGCATFSAVGCTLVMNALVNAFTEGQLSMMGLYVSLFAGFGTFFAVPLLFVARFTHERAPVSEHPDAFTLAVVISPFKVASFRRLTAMYLCPSITIDIVTAVILYYALYAVPGVRTVLFAGIFAVVTLVMLPVLLKLVDRVDKHVIYYTGLPAAVLAMVGIAFYPSGMALWPVYVLCAVFAVGLAAAQVMVWVMFPDVVDDGEVMQGTRNAGSFSGVMVLVRTLASALATFVVGWVLELTGYQHSRNGQTRLPQPDSALWGIRLTMLVAVVVLMGVGWYIARDYPLTRERVLALQEQLALSRAAHHAVVPEHPHVQDDSRNEGHGSLDGAQHPRGPRPARRADGPTDSAGHTKAGP
ncbi:MAG: MFS transporter [Actinomycetales bacterium]|nr:MFS transporter [Actinomycetales bacterium]